jgi:hypothetical protein
LFSEILGELAHFKIARWRFIHPKSGIPSGNLTIFDIALTNNYGSFIDDLPIKNTFSMASC